MLTAADLLDLPPLSQIYTHVGPDGTNTHVSVEHLRLHAEATKRPVERVAIDPREAHKWCQQNLVSKKRVQQLAKALIRPGKTTVSCEPLIFTFDADELGYLVDGRHRYVLLVALGATTVPAWLFPSGTWEFAQVSGLPDQTLESQSAAPPRHAELNLKGTR